MTVLYLGLGKLGRPGRSGQRAAGCMRCAVLMNRASQVADHKKREDKGPVKTPDGTLGKAGMDWVGERGTLGKRGWSASDRQGPGREGNAFKIKYRRGFSMLHLIMLQSRRREEHEQQQE